MSPALAGRFFTTVPPGKLGQYILIACRRYLSTKNFTVHIYSTQILLFFCIYLKCLGQLPYLQ